MTNFSRSSNVQCKKEHMPYQRVWSYANNLFLTKRIARKVHFLPYVGLNIGTIL